MDIGKLFKDAWGLFVKDIGPLIVGMFIASIVPALAAVIIAAATVGASITGLQIDSQGEVTGVDSLNWTLLGIGFLAVVAVTLMLSVPLYAGILSGVVRRVRDGRQMAYGDAFSGFGLFGRVIWAAILLGLIFLAVFLVPTAVIVAGALASSGIVVAFGVILVAAAIVVCVYLGVGWVYVFPMIVDRGLGVTESMGESRGLVRGVGWWWTFLALFVLQLVVGAASFALGLIPILGGVATIALYPFVLTFLLAMYFQSRGEGGLIDVMAALPVRPGGQASDLPVAPGAAPSSSPAAPYTPAAPPSPPAVPGQAYAPAPPPPATSTTAADGGSSATAEAPASGSDTAATQPSAPDAPSPPEPPPPVVGS